MPLREDSTNIRLDEIMKGLRIEELQIVTGSRSAPYPALAEFNSTTVQTKAGISPQSHKSHRERKKTEGLCLCVSVTLVPYTISIFAFARRLFARFERRRSYLLFCNSVRTSFLTSPTLPFCGGCMHVQPENSKGIFNLDHAAHLSGLHGTAAFTN